ncbi:MAG TPA: TonB-dependent receptor [Burkholderiaceae bacterium]|nr:TonB-dependent receptor [Burkholderiaceae bacterium]
MVWLVRCRRTPAALALALCATTQAQQPATPAPAAPDAQPQGTAQGIAQVIVITATRTARDQLEVPASVDVIDRDQMHDAQLRINASETLDRIPGVVALNRQNYAQDLQISIRGFGARSSFGVRGVRLYVDGVPATLPDGQGQVSNFPLNAAESIEVLRGPFSALYGNSSGGVIALTTALKPGPTAGEASFAAGTNSTTRSAADLAGGRDSIAYGLDGEAFHTGGFRPHSAAGRGILNFRLGLLDMPLGQLRLSANSLESDNAQDPMGLSRPQLQADPDQTTPEAVLFNTRKSTRQGTLGADLRSDLGIAHLETSVWTGARAIRQFQSIPPSSQNAASSPGGVIDLGRHFGGADSRATFEREIFTTTGGLDFERLVEDRFGYNNFISPSPRPIATSAPCGVARLMCGVLGKLRRDETNSLNSLDPYAQTEARLGRSWRVLAGVRSVHVDVNSSDHFHKTPTTNNSGSVSYSGLNPTAGVVFLATPQISYYASYGRGFETPTLNELAYKPDGSPGLNTSLKAARSNNYELGAKARSAHGLRGSVALFSTFTSDDIVVRSNFGGRSGYANVGRTRRDGVEAELEAHPADGLTLATSASLINARFESSFLTCNAPPCVTPNLRVASGNKLPSVPARTLWAEVKYDAGWASASLEGHVQSRLFVNDLNSDQAGGAGVLDAVVEHTGSWGSLRPHVFARVDNLTNRRYVGSVIVNDTNSRFFEPAPTRTWLFGVDLRF